MGVGKGVKINPKIRVHSAAGLKEKMNTNEVRSSSGDQTEGAEHQQSSLHLQNQGSSDDLSLCATPVPLLSF